MGLPPFDCDFWVSSHDHRPLDHIIIWGVCCHFGSSLGTKCAATDDFKLGEKDCVERPGLSPFRVSWTVSSGQDRDSRRSFALAMSQPISGGSHFSGRFFGQAEPKAAAMPAVFLALPPSAWSATQPRAAIAATSRIQGDAEALLWLPPSVTSMGASG